VVRNRAKRLLREVFRLHRHELAAPVEMVLVARAAMVGAGRDRVERDFLKVLRQAELLQSA
jgi:ribonuclease P protein component